MLDVTDHVDTTSSPLDHRTSGRTRKTAEVANLVSEPPQAKVLLAASATIARDKIERALRLMPRLEAQIAIAGTTAAALFALSNDDFDVVVIDGSVLVEVGSAATADGTGIGVVLVAEGACSTPRQAIASTARSGNDQGCDRSLLRRIREIVFSVNCRRSRRFGSLRWRDRLSRCIGRTRRWC